MSIVAEMGDRSLHIEDLSVAYSGTNVLEGVSASLHPGASLALIGPNGAGKTTLLRAILGLAPVTAGTVTVLGVSPAAARPRVAYVPQADSLDPEFPVSALQVVLMGRYRTIGFGRRPSKADRQTALNALERVGLTGRARDRFGVLSGGQRQRVLLARAIAQEAELLLLDEPFNGVDAVSQDQLIEVLDSMRAAGSTVVMSTHDLSVAHLACSDACLLNHHQFGFGPIAVTLTPAALRETYGSSAVVLAEGSTLLSSR